MAQDFPELKNILGLFGPDGVSADLLGEALTPEELDAFERRHFFRLPHILRAFYLLHNGMGDEVSQGSPHHNIVPLQSLGEAGGALRNTLYNHASDTREDRKLKKSELALCEPEPPDALLAIGMDASGDVYFLDFRKRTKQGIPVFLLHHDAAFEVDEVADSVEEFVFDFLSRRLGAPDERPAMPRADSAGKGAAELVREALPEPDPQWEASAQTEQVRPSTPLPIRAEIGSTNWRHSSSPEGDGSGIRFGCFSKEGVLLTLGQDALIHSWDMATGAITKTWLVSGVEPERFLMSPDESILVVLWREEYDSEDWTATVLSMADGSEVCRFGIEGMLDLVFSGDSGECVALSARSVVSFDPLTGRETWRLSLKKKEAAGHFAVSPEAGLIATDTQGNFPIQLWDRAGKRIAVLTGPEEEIRHIVFSADRANANDPARSAASLCVFAESLHVYEVRTHEAQKFALPLSDYRVAFCGEGRAVCTEFRYKKYDRIGFEVAIVDVRTGAVQARQSFDHVWGDIAASLSPDGSLLALLYERDLRVDLRSLPDWTPKSAPSDSFSDAALVAVWREGFVFSLRDTVLATDRSGRTLASHVIPGDSPSVFAASASSDGKVALSDTESRVHILTIPGLQEEARLKVPGYARTLAYAPIGGSLLIGCDGGALFLYERGRDRPAKLPAWLSAYTSQVTWSPDGALAMAADGVKAILFDVATRKVQNDRLSQGEYTWTVDFSQDGSRILVAGRDVSLRVLDLSGRELLRVPDVDTGRSWFLPDGRILVFEMNGVLHILDGATGAWLAAHNLNESNDCIVNVVPAPDRRQWFLKSSRGRLITCAF